MREGKYSGKAKYEGKGKAGGKDFPPQEGKDAGRAKFGTRGKKDDKPFPAREAKFSGRSKFAGKGKPGSKEAPFRREAKGTARPFRPGVRPKAVSRPALGDELIRLNKFISNAGICSRREADELIKAGVISVNGKVVTELGTKVKATDKIQYGDQTLVHEKKRYLLLNKPKGYITTTDDPYERKTVMSLVADACKERLYPIGRLDRNTTGLLLFTNDGELAKKLMHPRSRVNKTYHIVLDQPLKKADMLKIADGVELEGVKVLVDSIAYDIQADDKRELGLEIHSGQNRVVRRLFEAIGYKVTRLDRTLYAGLTKKNLPRGQWRFLEDREVNMLKML